MAEQAYLASMDTNNTRTTNGMNGQSSAPPPTSELHDYSLPTTRLRTKLNEKEIGKIPLVLCACGSFSPITYLHLRMFEMARDWVKQHTKYTVIGGYLSPVGDAYKKKGLAPAYDRVQMCDLAVGTVDPKEAFLMVDTWEAKQTEYQPTAGVLDHFDYEINTRLGGIDDGTGTGNRIKAKVALLGGADLVETFSQPGVWAHKDLAHILLDYGAFIIERAGTDLNDAMSRLEPDWKENVWVIHQQIRNDVSSTKIRTFLREQWSIRYLVPEPVISYIDKHHLYADGEGTVKDG